MRRASLGDGSDGMRAPRCDRRGTLAAIASDRSRPLKHTQRAHIVLLSAERLSVQDVARRAGLSRPAVWRWQRRYAEAGVEGLLRDKTCRSAHL